MLFPFNKSLSIQTVCISVMCLKGRWQPSTENKVTGTHAQLDLSVHPAPRPLPQCCPLTLLLSTLAGTVLSRNVCDVLGISDIWRCGCRLHPGRVGPAGHIPEEALQRRDAGEHQSPGVPGWVLRVCVWIGGRVLTHSSCIQSQVSRAASTAHCTLCPGSPTDLVTQLFPFTYIQSTCPLECSLDGSVMSLLLLSLYHSEQSWKSNEYLWAHVF